MPCIAGIADIKPSCPGLLNGHDPYMRVTHRRVERLIVPHLIFSPAAERRYPVPQKGPGEKSR
jgi:hypothetical protein